MSDLIWLTEAQMRRIEPYFPLWHGVPRVDDQRIISGIISSSGTAYAGATRLLLTVPPKAIYNPVLSLSKGGSSAGADWGSSTGSSQASRRRAASLTI